MKEGYDEKGNKTHENVPGCYYDKSGNLIIIYKPSQHHTKWNKKKKIWEYETPKFDIEAFGKKVDTFIYQTLERGFIFKQGEAEHIQQCRDREIILLNATVTILQSESEGATSMWRHSDTDVQKYGLETLLEILKQGKSFAETVYGVRDIIVNNQKECNSLEDFISYVNQYSEIKVRKGV